MTATTTGEIARRRPPRTRAALLRIGALIVLLVAATFLGYRLGWFNYRDTLVHAERLRRGHSFAWVTGAFVVVYAIATAVGVPGLPFTVAGGALFGTLLGTALSWTGAMLGAVGGYWLARTVGHGVVARWIKRFRRVDAAMAAATGFAGMLRLRLIPIIPLAMVNFAGGLSRAPFVPYLAATAIGILPSTIIYTYFADALIDGIASGKSSATTSLLIASALLMGLSLLPRLVRDRA